MRILFCVALASLMTISTAFAGEVETVKKRRGNLFKHDYTAAYSVQTVSVKTACFSGKAGSHPCPYPRRNRPQADRESGHRRMPAPHSTAIAGSGIFACLGMSDKAIIAAASTAPVWRHRPLLQRHIHVDVGPQRRWTHLRPFRS